MHERSQTIQREDGRYVNVYGPGALGGAVGQPLPKKYHWEQDSYRTVGEAVHAARKRSEFEGKKGQR